MALGDELYEGTAEFGRIEAVIGVVFGTIFGVIAIIVGIFLLLSKNKHTKNVMGTITSASCPAYVDNNTIKYNCNLV